MSSEFKYAGVRMTVLDRQMCKTNVMSDRTQHRCREKPIKFTKVLLCTNNFLAATRYIGANSGARNTHKITT